MAGVAKAVIVRYRGGVAPVSRSGADVAAVRAG